MHSVPLLDCAGRRRSPATMSGFHQGRPPRSKGLRYPPDPPTVEEIIGVMRAAGHRPDGLRLRRGKGGKRREVRMDRWAWEQLEPWLTIRGGLPVGALFCVLRGPTCGRPCSPSGIRVQLRNIARAAGVRRRFAPHQLRHAHAVETSREGVPLVVIQRQLGHADLGITSAYLRGIDSTEIVDAVHERPAPMIPATNALRSSR